MSWLSACRLLDIDFIVSYYGTHIYQFKTEKPKCPCLLHFAKHDDLVPIEHGYEIKHFHPSVRIKIYNATHGFRCEDWDGGNDQEYDPNASQLADKMSEHFIVEKISKK